MIEYVAKFTIPAALELLPRKMDTLEARAMLLAIGLQESRFLERRQQRRGPALSFWQFEPGVLSGFAGVFRHAATKDLARHVAGQLRYTPTDPEHLRRAAEHNDVLACAIARLLLWTLPGALPRLDERDLAWQQYLDAWRPGEPKPETWKALHEEAVARVTIEIDRDVDVSA